MIIKEYLDSLEPSTPETFTEEQLKESFEAFIELDVHLENIETSLYGLESIRNQLKTQLKERGLSPITAQFLHLAVEGFTQPIGVHSTDLVPSVESFNNAPNHSTTKITIESIEQTVDKIWNTVKEIVAAIWKKINEFIKRYFTQFGVLKGKVDALIKSVSVITVEKQLTVRVPRILRYNNEIPSFSGISKEINALEETTKVLKTRYIPEARMYIQSVVDDLNTLSEEDVNKKNKENFNVEKVLHIEEGHSPLLIGDKYFIIDQGSGIPSLVDLFNKESLDADKLLKRDVMVRRAEIESLLKGVKDLTDISISTKNDIDQFQRFYFQNQGAIDRLTDKIKEAVIFMAKSRALRKNILKPVIQLLQHNYQVCNGAFMVAEYCISQKQNNDQ